MVVVGVVDFVGRVVVGVAAEGISDLVLLSRNVGDAEVVFR